MASSVKVRVNQYSKAVRSPDSQLVPRVRERCDTDPMRSRARNVVNQETSTSSSCPLPISILKSIPHVVMRTISDEEAKKAKTKLSWLKDGATPRKKSIHSGENTGRWTKEEHGIFLLGLEKHGKEWKEISHMIPTRSVVQIRTHAQKYFQKVAKARAKEGKLDPSSGEHSEIVSTASSTVSSSNNTKRKRSSKKVLQRHRSMHQKGVPHKKRQKKPIKKFVTTTLEDCQALSPLSIRAPGKASSVPISASFVDDFDDNIIGTPTSVAGLFDMDVAIRQLKSTPTVLPFLEDDLGRFDFGSNSDASTENYASSTASSPFECENTPMTKITKSTYVGNRMVFTDTLMTFTDLDMEDEKCEFISGFGDDSPDYCISSDEHYTPKDELCQAINEEEFISGLLA